MTAPSFATYATLADVRRYLGELEAITPADQQSDLAVMEALRFATRYIDQQTRRSYFPVVETRYFDAGIVTLGGDVDGYDLQLGEGNGLIEVTSVTNGNGDSISSDEYRLYSRTGNAPYDTIRTTTTAWTIDTQYGGKQAIAIAGRWVDSDQNASGWLTGYDTVQDNPLTDSATTVTVAWTTNFDPLNRTPRFSPGMLGRFGTSEYFTVLSTNRVNGTGSTLDKIRRGERGTTPAEQAQNTTISVWEVDEVIRQACTELAAWKYQQRGQGSEDIPAGIQAIIGSGKARYFVGAV